MLQVDLQPPGTSFASIRATIVSRLLVQGKPLTVVGYFEKALG
jgi:hypothetical protein